MDETAERPVRRRKTRTNPAKADLAKAMLASGYTYRSTAKTLGLSQPTLARYRKQDLADPAHAESIKKGLRNRFAIIADKSLSCMDDSKLADASAKDLMYIAAKATEMAGLAPPSIVENYSRSISEYIIQDGSELEPVQVVNDPAS